MTMALLKQSLIMTRVSLASLPQRFGPSLIIVVSTTCVVGVLLSMLSETAGVVRTNQLEGSPERAIVLPAQIPSEYGNTLSRNDIATIMSAPGIATGRDGSPAADAEILLWIPPTEGHTIGSPELRGVGPVGLSLRPEFAMVSGRLFQPGRQELIVGVRAERAFGLKVGQKVILPNGEWPIVGAFSAGGALVEAQLVADADTVMAVSKISGFGSVLVKLDNVGAFDAFRQWLTTNPTLAVTAERQSEYYLRTAERYSAFFTELAYAVGIIMTLGALFGSAKIMHTAVSVRTREIATLRAIGYEPLPTAIAVVVEMIVLSLTGACLGASLAWVLFDGKVMAGTQSAFDLSVSPRLFILGVGWAMALAILGGLPPAIRAARLSVTDALRQV
jgi:putative ABC transport system permease protein